MCTPCPDSDLVLIRNMLNEFIPKFSVTLGHCLVLNRAEDAKRRRSKTKFDGQHHGKTTVMIMKSMNYGTLDVENLVNGDAEVADETTKLKLKNGSNSQMNFFMTFLVMIILSTLAFVAFPDFILSMPVGLSMKSLHRSNDALSFDVHTSYYGKHSPDMLGSYGFKAIFEPFRDLVIKPTNGRDGSTYSWRIIEKQAWDTSEDIVLADNVVADELMLHITSKPPRQYVVELTETDSNGIVSTVSSTDVYSKYVRRELRSLSKEDRDAFFSALQKVYSLTDDEGKALYGDNFRSYQFFTAKHNSQDWCYHGGLQFFTTHAGFTLDLDRVIQTIDSRLITPYWDFMIDASKYPLGEWYQSDIYGDDMYGPVNTLRSDGYLIKSGLYQNISLVYKDSIDYELFDYLTNSYNVNTDIGNQIHGEYIMRSNEMCGWVGKQPLPTCSRFLACLDDYGTNLANFEICLEKNVHANYHAINAGIQSCADDWNEVLEVHPTWEPILSFLGASSSNIWYKYAHLKFSWVSCPSSCDVTVDCPCTSSFDVSSLNDEEVYDYISQLYSYFDLFYMGTDVMAVDSNGKYYWIGFSEEEQPVINRFVLKHTTSFGTIGQIASGAGPNDPIFFAFHPIFDRMYTGYQLSSTYQNGGVNMDWTSTESCTGAAKDDLVPFEGLFPSYDAAYNITGYYTNEQMMTALSPTDRYVSYVFDSFDSWGNCTYDISQY